MSVFGTLVGVAVGAATTAATGGNVAVGITAGQAAGGLASGGGSSSSSCPPDIAGVTFLLQNISAADRAAWMAFNPTTGGRAGGRWNIAIQNNQVALLASYVVGEEDCKLASDEKLLVQNYQQLLAKYGFNAVGASVPLVVSDPNQRGGLSGAVSAIGDAVTQTGQNIIRGAVAGATSAAQGASQGSGAAVTNSQLGGILVPLALGIAGFFVVFKLAKS